MIIKLKNGQNIELDWNFLVMEYIEEYEGGLKGLKSDLEAKRNQLKVNNHLLYSLIRANVDEPLTYRQAVCLVNIEDMNKISDFITTEMKKLDEFKKKEVQKYPPNFKRGHQRR
jgi:hypothetical protein